MSKHLTRGDRRFLASVELDSVRQLDAIEALMVDIEAAEQAAGVTADLSALEALDDEATLSDHDRLTEIRADLRSQLGQIGRLEPSTEETATDE